MTDNPIDLSIGSGAQYAVLIECTPEQKVCLDQWFRAKGLVQFLDGLSSEKPSTPAVFSGTWNRTYNIGEGERMEYLIDCTPEQDVIVDSWFRAHDLRGFMDQLHKSSQPVKAGEKRPCGCGE